MQSAFFLWYILKARGGGAGEVSFILKEKVGEKIIKIRPSVPEISHVKV